MVFKTIEKFFGYVSGFINGAIINRFKRGRKDLEAQLTKSTEKQSMHATENQALKTEEDRQVKPMEETPTQPAEAAHLDQDEDRRLQLAEERPLKSAIESLLFVADSPLSLDRLKGIFEEATREELEAQIGLLGREYETRGSGIMLAEVAGGYQLGTRPENAVWIRKFKAVKVSSRLSKPALETLAIVAYKQPITRSEVEAVRGVNIGGIMRNLMERRLVKIVGKKDVPGKPMLYGTTLEFLQYFGLKDLSALPTLREFQELEAGEELMDEVPLEGEPAAPAEGAASTAADDAHALTAAATGENATG
jgi:segregation and condensation protein B